MTRRVLGIAREAYSKWERRAPLTPAQVGQLVRGGGGRQQQHNGGLRVLIQPSTQRIFTDAEYLASGAEVSESLEQCDCIVGVKQVKPQDLLRDKTYLFFSHTIKAQPENMPLLDRVLEQGVRLVDHECIRDERTGARLVAFGEYAGRAGMLESIRGLGLRLLGLGYSTPLLHMGPVFSYKSYDAALAAAQAAVADYSQQGGSQVFLPPGVGPMCVVFTGAGKVSRGAQQVFNQLPHTEMLPNIDALADEKKKRKDPRMIYGLCVRDEDVIRSNNNNGASFDKADYRRNPSRYNADLFAERVLPHANLVLMGAYWDSRFPRWMPDTRLVRDNAAKSLLMVSDVSCDVNGSFQGLSRTTTIDDPFMWVDFTTKDAMREVPAAQRTMQVERNMQVKLVLGVDILPSELAREASQHFGDCLMPFVHELCQPDFTSPSLQRAVIAEKGRLADSFSYIGKMHQERQRASKAAIKEGMTVSAVLELQGHLFDTRLVNRVLDLVENKGAAFQLNQAGVAHPRQGFARAHTRVQLQIATSTAKELEELIGSIESLVREAPEEAEAVVTRAAVAPTVAAAAPKAPKQPSEMVVVFGSGLVSAPAIDYLTRVCGKRVLVVSGSEQELAALAKRFASSGLVTTKHADLSTTAATASIANLLSGARCALSLLPPPMHLQVAKSCLLRRVPLVTASYVGQLAQLYDEAKRLGVPLLCEMGLDPGMDHMSVMRVVKRFGGASNIVAFESYCGGLVSPECANNPMGYKLTWSPRGVLTALNNPAQFVRDSTVVQCTNILTEGQPFEFNSLTSLNLEYMPNRDSLPYAMQYGLDLTHMRTFLRGTLRYQGFTDVMQSFRKNGWLEDNAQANQAWEREKAANQVESLGLRWADVVRQQDFSPRAWAFLLPHLHRTVDATSPSKLDALCSLLREAIPMERGDRDLVLMEHRFTLRDGRRVKSTFMRMGNEQDSAMATTVGLTAAVGVRLVLQGEFHGGGGGGIHLPTASWVFGPALDLLQEQGIRFDERVEEEEKR